MPVWEWTCFIKLITRNFYVVLWRSNKWHNHTEGKLRSRCLWSYLLGLSVSIHMSAATLGNRKQAQQLPRTGAEKKMGQTPMMTSSSSDPTSQNASLTVSSKFYNQKYFCAAGWDSLASETTLAKTWHKPCIFPWHWDKTSCLRTNYYYYPNFLRVQCHWMSLIHLG